MFLNNTNISEILSFINEISTSKLRLILGALVLIVMAILVFTYKFFEKKKLKLSGPSVEVSDETPTDKAIP